MIDTYNVILAVCLFLLIILAGGCQEDVPSSPGLEEPFSEVYGLRRVLLTVPGLLIS
jgi:hypothetical protein